MFKCVLKSLSDTELVSIASELTKPEIKTKSITSQLVRIKPLKLMWF